MKRLVFLFLLCSAPAFAQFGTVSQSPLSGNCPSHPTLGIDVVNGGLYYCAADSNHNFNGPFQWYQTLGNGSNIFTGPQQFLKQPWTDAVAAGAKCDDTTDDTAAISAALTALYNQGGGTLMIPPGKVCKIAGQITLPNDAQTTPSQKPIRITSWGPSSMASAATGIQSPNGAGALDLQNNSATTKIDTRGNGYLEIDHVILEDTSTDCAAFVFTTNTVLHIHDVEFYGTATGTSACNDAIILGGTGTTINGTSTAPFQGYGTVIRDNFFNKIKRAVFAQTFANGIQIVDNTVWNSSGFSTGGAIEFTTGTISQFQTGNYIAGNLIEVTNYKYGISFTSYATTNTVASNNCFDASATNTSCVNFGANADYNMVIAGWGVDSPQTYMTDTDSLSTLFTSHQSQPNVMPGPWIFTNTATPIQLKAAGGGQNAYDILNTTNNDEIFQILTNPGTMQWQFRMNPAGAGVETPFTIIRSSSAATIFSFGKSADTTVFLQGSGGQDIKVASNGAGNVVWLCGGSRNCNNFIDASGNHQYTGAGTGPSALHLLQHANHDLAGTCTAATATTCTVTFTTAYNSAPVCTATDATNIVALKVTPSTTGLVITTAASSSDVFDYHCIGNPN